MIRSSKSAKDFSDNTTEDKKVHGAEVKSTLNFGCGCCRLGMSGLCVVTEIPEWMRRPHIIGGYRPDLSPLSSLKSIIQLHNESGNIWTHLCGFVIVMRLALKCSSESDEMRPFAPELVPFEIGVLRAFLIAAAGCLLLSAAYHTGNCSHNQARCDALLRADASGVAVLIAASFLPGAYYGFACFPSLRRTYLFVTAGLLVVGLGVSLADAWANREDGSSAPGGGAASSYTSTGTCVGAEDVASRGFATNANPNLGKGYGGNYGAVSSGPLDDLENTPAPPGSSFDSLPASATTAAGTTIATASNALTAEVVAVAAAGTASNASAETGAGSRLLASAAGASAPLRAAPSLFASWIQRVRVATFVTSVCLGFCGAMQWTFLVQPEARYAFLPKVFGSIGFYALGFVFYASGFPERLWPGSFDYALHSHQIWHVCVVMAVLTWYWACLDTTEALGTKGCGAFIAVSAADPNHSGLRKGGAGRSGG